MIVISCSFFQCDASHSGLSRSNSLEYRFAYYLQAFPSVGIHTAGHPSVIAYHHVKGCQQANKTPQRRHSAFTECVRNSGLLETVIWVKHPALARFSPDIAPLFVHFRADDDVTARLYA
ncbi:hypothetical protein BGS_0707 [Beggiatoa sp. SS]|nr:hypothetical protein BGS_0707 [Beggiatoa sp. SS]